MMDIGGWRGPLDVSAKKVLVVEGTNIRHST